VSDRSWTVTPVLVWFGGFLVVGLVALDGDLSALAGRLTAPRSTLAAPAIAPPVQVAEADDDADADTTDVATGGGAVANATAATRDVTGALEDTCLEGTPDACKRWAMDGFYQAVAADKHGTLGHPVRVSWYGDSVIATDMIPGHLRVRMQEALGDGGPGFVYAIPPHKFYNQEAVSRSSTGTWSVHAISTLHVADGLYGPAGSTAETFDGGTATIKLNSGKVTNAELFYLAQPSGGTVTVTGDGSELVTASTAADVKRGTLAGGAIKDGAREIKVATHGKVRLFGIDLFNAKGATVDNLGIVSVNVKSFGFNNSEHWQATLGQHRADLIMIMIGANEAEWLTPGDRDTKDYQAHYEQVLAPIRKGVPGAACLVVSPTDQAEVFEGAYRSRPVMPLLVDAQRKAAQAQGCAFYSTYDWMGGKGSAAKWFKKGLVSSDFQHLSKKGANKMADAVFDALMAGYKKYAHE
jgi:lysophospholipase L1-like esterase